jgi:RimJ/RimL family protein N-acetyltransferase
MTAAIVATMPEPLHTDRLQLDPWTEAHTKLLAQLAMTPSVMRYIGDGTLWSEARIHDVAQHNLRHWSEHGFGWRVAMLDGAAIGLIALNFAGQGAGVDAGEYEIGWWLAPSTWGRGLAREGATAVRDEGFARVGAPSILARIQPANHASLAVAEAIGLTYESSSTGRGSEPISVLRLSARRWRERLSSSPGSPPAAPPAAPA